MKPPKPWRFRRARSIGSGHMRGRGCRARFASGLAMMDREKVRNVYLDAANLPEHARAAFLSRQCQGDSALRAEVESLLSSLACSPRFMVSPTVLHSVTPGEGPGMRIGPYRLLQ